MPTKPDKSDNQKCPKCNFSGSKQFPKGYATEQHQKTDSSGDIIHGKDGNVLFFKITRYPKCGFQDKVN